MASQTWRVDTRTLGSKTVARLLWQCEGDSSESESDTRKKKEEWGQPASGRPIYRGSTESARYGSFPRTTHLNSSILISLRDNLDGFVANWLQP
jgi:hypothetical protein